MFPTPPPPKKKHWKEDEFPGFTEGSVPPRRSPIKNVKKKLDDRAEAKAWVPTVTETLADKIQKKLWEDALEVRKSFVISAKFCSKIRTLSEIVLI